MAVDGKGTVPAGEEAYGVPVPGFERGLRTAGGVGDGFASAAVRSPR